MFERFLNVDPKSKSLPEKAAKDFERYKKWLHLDEKQLHGKNILDIGSAGAYFGEYVEQKYPGTTVLRFDFRQGPDNRVDFIAEAKKLPLKAGSIDIALAHASITNNSGEEVVAALKEIFPTVKDGGEIHIAPLFDAPFKFSQERLRLVREFVADLEIEGSATAEWIFDGTEERTLPKSGERIKESRYCLVIKKHTIQQSS